MHPAQVAALKLMTAEQKLGAIVQMWRAGREMMAMQYRAQYPGWDEAEVQAAVTRRIIAGHVREGVKGWPGLSVLE